MKIFVKPKINSNFWLKMISISIISFALSGILFATRALDQMEQYLHAFIVQWSFDSNERNRQIVVPSEKRQVFLVKKDHATSELLDSNPGRREFASLFQFLGSEHEIKRGIRSRAKTIDLISFKFGIYNDLKGLPIFSFYDRIATMRGKNSSSEFTLKDKSILSLLDDVLKYYSKNQENKGTFSFIKFEDQIWRGRGQNVFKALSSSSKPLLMPTLLVDWGNPAFIDVIKKIKSGELSNKEVIQKYEKESDLISRWVRFFLSLCYTDFNFKVNFLPEKDEGTWLSFILEAKLNEIPSDLVLEPADVIGFDFILQGDSDNPETDELLIQALKNSKSRVVLACHEFKESLGHSTSAEAEIKYVAGEVPNDNVEPDKLDKPEKASVMIRPNKKFLVDDDRVIEAAINVNKFNKGYSNSVPLFVENVEEKCLIPCFSLAITCCKLDAERDKIPMEQREDGESYIQAMRKELKRLYKEVASGTLQSQIVSIKDLQIPIDSSGYFYITYFGSTSKSKDGDGYKDPAFSSASFYECFSEDYLAKSFQEHPEKKELNPSVAHAKTLLPRGDSFSNKAVLCGPFEITDFDYFPTPLTVSTPLRSITKDLMGVEIHTNAVVSLLNNRVSFAYDFGALYIVCLLVLCLALTVLLECCSPQIGAFLSIIMSFFCLFIKNYLYHYLDIIVFMSPFITAAIFIWLLITLVNYIIYKANAKNTKDMFARFVSSDVVQYMLEHPDMVRPGGQKVKLTVFFSDIAGFTSISEKLSPEELVNLLNEYLEAMTDILFKYGGTLDKFIGDAVMAFWNYPRNQEDHALRACLAAIEMQNKLAELQKDWMARGLPKVAARCGLNSADVIVGYMGSIKSQMNFTCMGDGVNLASRLEGANKEYGTKMMISEAVYLQVKDRVTCRFLDYLAVKGKLEPVKVFQLVSEKGNEPEGFTELHALYDEAIELHLQRKWDEAIAMFDKILEKWPDDGPSKTYKTRCIEYKDNPPPENWDGRYILTHK